MNSEHLLKKAMAFEFLSAQEGQFLFESCPTAELMWVANELRKFKNQTAWSLGKLIEM